MQMHFDGSRVFAGGGAGADSAAAGWITRIWEDRYHASTVIVRDGDAGQIICIVGVGE